MKKLISKFQTKKDLFSKFLFLTTLISVNYVFPQCVDVDAGVDQTSCGGAINLSMTYTPVKATTSYTVAPIIYNPVSFTTGSLALATNIDDTYSGSIPIGFCFKFYGNTYTQCFVGSNGLITFDPADANQYCEWVITNSLPSNSLPMNSIMAPYHDILPSVDPASGTSEIKYNTYGTAPCRTFVISWSNIPMFDCTDMIDNQQIILYETTNVIEVYIKDKPLCTTWNDGLAILGIQNSTGTVFTAAAGKNSTQWAATNEGYRFSPAGVEVSTVQWFQGGTPIATTAATIVSPSVTTTYTAQVTIPTCVAPGSLVITDDVVVTVSSGVIPIFSSIASVCQNAVAPILPLSSTNVPPVIGTWSPVVSTSTIGTTTYTFTPAAGQCASVATLDIIVTTPIVPTFLPVSGVCQSDVLALLPSTSLNLVTGSWSIVLGSATSGSIPYSFTPATGQCASSVTMTINVVLPVNTTFTPLASICQNDIAPILPVNSTNVPVVNGSWSSTVNTGILGLTTYTFTPATGQCATLATMDITITPLIVPTFSPISLLCLNATPPVLPINSTDLSSVVGIWTPSVISTTSIGTITYTFNPSIGQCSASTTMDIITTNEVTPLFAAIPPICYGSLAPVLASASVNLPVINGVWSSVINTSVIGVQSYIFTPLAGQCASTFSLDVIVNPLPELVVHDPLPVCAPSKVDITAPAVTSGSTGVFSYFVAASGSIPLSSPSLINASGTYYIESESSFGCKVIMPVNVVVNLQPHASFNPSDSKLNVFNSSSTMVNSSTGDVSSSWVFSDGTTSSLNSPEHIFSDTAYGDQIVMLIVTSSEGCMDTTTRTVNMEEELLFYVPNTFTPDDDVFNQTFKPVFASGYDASDYTMLIYDRWGQLVFETHDVYNAWNGDLKGSDRKVSDGVYVWKMEFKINRRDEHVMYVGNVNILR